MCRYTKRKAGCASRRGNEEIRPEHFHSIRFYTSDFKHRFPLQDMSFESKRPQSQNANIKNRGTDKRRANMYRKSFDGAASKKIVPHKKTNGMQKTIAVRRFLIPAIKQQSSIIQALAYVPELLIPKRIQVAKTPFCCPLETDRRPPRHS